MAVAVLLLKILDSVHSGYLMTPTTILPTYFFVPLQSHCTVNAGLCSSLPGVMYNDRYLKDLVHWSRKIELDQ